VNVPRRNTHLLEAQRAANLGGSQQAIAHALIAIALQLDEIRKHLEPKATEEADE
jgi:hypothetical protein